MMMSNELIWPEAYSKSVILPRPRRLHQNLKDIFVRREANPTVTLDALYLISYVQKTVERSGSCCMTTLRQKELVSKQNIFSPENKAIDKVASTGSCRQC